MSDEEKTQTEENTGDTDSQTETGKTEKTEVKDEIDWEQRYKDGQEKIRQQGVRLAEVERQTQEREEAAQQTEEETGYEDDQFVSRKTVDNLIEQGVKKAVTEIRLQTADSYFRRTYPDIVKHENIISGIMRNPTDPEMLKKGVSAEARIDSAVKEFNALTSEAIETAKTEAETEAKEREEQNRKATGLGGASTSSSKSDTEGESDQDYINKRKARSAKQRGLA